MLIHHNEQNCYDYENWEICSLTENSCARETRFYEVALLGFKRSDGTALEVWHYTTKAEAVACYKEINLESLFLGAPLEFKQNVTIYKNITFFDLKKDEEEELVYAKFGDEWKMLDCYLVEDDDGKTKTLFFETVGSEEKMYIYDGVYADEDWSLEEQYKLATEDDCRALSEGKIVTSEQKKALLEKFNILDDEKFRRKGC